MKCSICENNASPYCSTLVLNKYQVQYYRCVKCYFIFTESPYWLNEAYNSAITKLDIGLVERNMFMIPIVKAVIERWFNAEAKFIDYGGGYGMLVRMMRDRGYNFYRQDIHCENIYAEFFDVSDVPAFKGEILTAFEVMEHLINPIDEVNKMLKLSDTILFSTTVQPERSVTPDSWWYFTPETGQHISLYSRQSLYAMAEKLGMYYCWNKHNVHLFSRKKINDYEFKLITRIRVMNMYNKLVGERTSLKQSDYLKIKNIILTGKGENIF